MKKALLLAWLLGTMSTMAMAADWVKPVYQGKYQPLTVGDTVYIYNVEAQLFLTEGNDWGTHGTVGEEGLLFVVNSYAEEGKEWDGATYTIRDYSVVKAGWYDLFINAEGIYVDRGSQEDYFFSFKDMGNNTYQIYGADINPTYNATGEMEGYMLGRYTDYTNIRDGIWTGTGVIYDYYGEDNNYGNQFQPTWAFVSQTDYAAYGKEVARYLKAMELKAMLDEADKMGMTTAAEEKAVLADTSSTMEQLEAALASLNTKMLAFYEKTVTPENPVIIDNDVCDAIDGWINAIDATTWNTQTWIGDGWQGFEGTTLNIWGSSMEGTAYKYMENLPNGIYVVSMAVYSQDLGGFVVANENAKAVPAGAAGNVYEVTTNVTNGTLTYGFTQEVEGTNWVAIDNAVVKYYGSGLDAYRYWLKSLSESAASFDGVAVQDSLVEEYNKVLKAVEAAETEEDIRKVIPAYEAIINELNLNISAYTDLGAVIDGANEMAAREDINEYYGDLLSDAVMTQAQPVMDEHKLSTAAVEAVSDALEALVDEAQQYLWNMETLTYEVEVAATIYEEYKDQCASAAAEAYEAYMAAYAALDVATLTADDVKALTDELYAVEFNLALPVEEASDEHPVDYTAKVQYPSFDGGTTGWTNDGWSTCGSNTWTSFADGEVIDTQYLNLWNEGTARVYQTLTNLPAGTYTLQISAFADAEGLQVYANNDYMNVVVGQNNEEGSEFYGVARIFSSTATEVHEGTVWYGNIYQITTVVGEDGIMEIGARNVNDAAVWAMIDNVELKYYGTHSSKVTGIEGISTPTAKSDGRIYNLAGQAVDASYKGIVIKNGKKVLVK
ncbi:MAG: hypothetical protein IJP82_10435 [Bacteroidaceae bacterium]|nr:hypothetical protein [Bacteroidaceae bacterium]